jgi:hypothetical protein
MVSYVLIIHPHTSTEKKNWMNLAFLFQKKISKITQFKLGRKKKKKIILEFPLDPWLWSKSGGTKVQKLGGTPPDLLLLVRAHLKACIPKITKMMSYPTSSHPW